MQHHRSLLLFGFLCAVLVLSLSSCSQRSKATDPRPLYEEAARLEQQRRYPEALVCYDKALAADTLNGFTRSTLEALCRKSRIEFMIGSYAASYRTYGIIERHAGSALPDSLLDHVVLDTAQMYAEQGMYGKAASMISALRNPDAWQRFEQARLLLRSGDASEASRICGELSLSEDPLIRMAGYSGLLDCAVFSAGSVAQTPESLAGRVVAQSGNLFRTEAPAGQKIRVLRVAARSLRQLEPQRPNASFLLFRALAIAQQAGLNSLVPILQYESNELIVRKPDTWLSLTESFAQMNLPYARAAALCKLGESPELTVAQRVEAFRSGLEVFRYYGIPATASGYAGMIRDAVRQFEELLIAEGRYVELFDLDGQSELLELRSRLLSDISGFTLPAGHEALRNEIIALNSDIAGLLQRRISMFEEGRDIRLAVLTDKAITQKQGRLLELITEASRYDAAVSLRLQPEPLTLRTLQKNLKPDQALVKVYLRDSLSTVIAVSRSEMQIVTSDLSATEITTGFEALLRRFSDSEGEDVATLVKDAQRLRLTEMLLQSMNSRLMDYQHLIFVSPEPQPFHLLGRDVMLGQVRKVSWVVSANEIRPERQHNGGGNIAFFDVYRSGSAQLHKLFHPDDRVFLLWKPMSEQEKVSLITSIQKGGDSSGADTSAPKHFPADTALTGRYWYRIGSYGID